MIDLEDTGDWPQPSLYRRPAAALNPQAKSISKRPVSNLSGSEAPKARRDPEGRGENPILKLPK